MPSALAILPLKNFDASKQRLAGELSAAPRRALAEAMFADVLIALRRCRAVDGVLVVSADNAAQQIAASHGAGVIEDATVGHSEAAAVGVAHAREQGVARVLLVPGDCPLLDPAELEALIAHPVSGRSALIIADRHGTGTNALLLTPPDALTPSFGPGSCARHGQLATEQGATPEVVPVPSLALDIDTPEDLHELRATLSRTRGGAAHTRGMLSQLLRSAS
jgi:2-phospho-L-lactate guanylyltransferase